MEQLPGIPVYLAAAFIVPVVFARLIIRAAWKTVVIANGIWYGFLVLAFGGPVRQEALGLALIFAMLYSALMLPILALMPKIGSFLWRRLALPCPRRLNRLID